LGSAPTQIQLARDAAAGDRSALDRLLLREYDPLLRFIRSLTPQGIARRVAPEDLLQETLLRAARGIKSFDCGNPDGLRPWLHAIARNVIHDARKAHQAGRRDERREVRQQRAAPDDSVIALLDLLPADGRTPSRSAARHEAAAAIRVALTSIPDDYRRAITLRYIDALPVAEIAAQMGRTDRAVHMLCNRGLKALAEAMGSASMFLSTGA